MNKQVIDLLVEGRKTISNFKNWCQHHYVTDKTNDTFQYCAVGAIKYKGATVTTFATATSLLNEEMKNHIVKFNDRHHDTRFLKRYVHRDVLAAYDRAIEKANALLHQ